MHTVTSRQGKSGTIDIKALLAGDEEFLRALVRTALQEVLEAEMTEALGAERGERTAGRLGKGNFHQDSNTGTDRTENEDHDDNLRLQTAAGEPEVKSSSWSRCQTLRHTKLPKSNSCRS